MLAGATPAERRTLQLTAIPVSFVHDEYMFIRALQAYETMQAYETIFALIGIQLAAAVGALTRGAGPHAADALRAANATLREASGVWSLVATM